GYASEALQLVCDYAFTHLSVHQVYANITEDNLASIKLFEKTGFTKTGTKLDWIYSQDSFKNELHYQLINNVS
ncbi:MAG: GNAT family N-acetyltransferase, partial [Bacteroidetes bacterium]|nr:GNAT family N-acetyltransferase [Bacteroidota bacterium]